MSRAPVAHATQTADRAGPRGHPVFLEKSRYRQRRLRDGARLLPVFGVVLICVPLLWSQEAEQRVTSSTAAIYLFGVWALVIVLAGILAARLRVSEVQSDLAQTAQTPPQIVPDDTVGPKAPVSRSDASDPP